ncbi:tRNA (adenosine(37)-N6)-threonylcarbamoyltransferase complex dimerization subunit type 1 TsaB [Thermomicrobium sp. 4228-Ro]|uniref:tRNA (adenosine(37)-N6)-threonylcarbamoyltransferase complex dimerization subunit type 1 TsaB n=1 Tax=Thermomicrobium sp. 4228-Ro TaxID=2993937 RepID=UPI002248DAEF|nr:tRNA (adenosine(37)-N6)-threonylcarbamoyltransferase complex dimerization subunit type 1 TsaB [Thermomicrobium sp. 4228-Ro]MCX2726751.1 tRNA (adenosine(37)-N6)-threonylcarbamoyltransferase complex dimerization subunit type 1 TsaB [Thermomicrobium sp. 4228-Ro]
MARNGRLLLALDTGGERVALALYDGQIVGEFTYDAGREHTATVLPAIQHLLRANRRRVEEIGAVAVTTGPGSFNGLRVGMSIAKALCYALDVPLFGVLTLDALAYPHTALGFPIRAFVPAGRGRVVYADYRRAGAQWTRESILRSARLDELTMGLIARTVLAGPLAPEHEEIVRRHPSVILPVPSLRELRPAWVAELAYRRWRAGESDPVAALEPIYVHGGGSATVPSVQLPESYDARSGQE